MTTIQTSAEERPREPRDRWTTIEEMELHRVRVSWGALFAGAAVALVLSVVLNMLGYGIGAVALDPAQSGQAQTFGVSAGIWTLIVSLIALFAGGWIAARLSGRGRRFEGILHGVVTWSLVTLAVLWLVTTAVGSLVGGAFSVIGEAAPAMAGQAQQQAAQVGQQQAQQIAGGAADITGGSAIVLAVAMLLGALAAAGGGLLGASRQRRELRTAGASVH